MRDRSLRTAAPNRSTSRQRRRDSVLNSATTAKMIAKHRSVWRSASAESTKRYCCMGMLNSPAVRKDSPWDSASPSTRPAASDAAPTQAVSMSTMADTWAGRMPRRRYTPNSRLRLRMRKRFA